MAKYNMKNNKNKNGQKKKRTKGYYERRRVKVISIALVCFVLFAGVSLTVYSKYYKTGYNKGIATASGFYFDSNYLKDVNSEEIQSISSIQELAENTELVSQLILSSNESMWTSVDAYHFMVEIRNYTNQILYNDKDLNISYTVEFMLLDAPKEASYGVRQGLSGPYQTLSDTAAGVAVFQSTLDGGELNWDTFDLEVRLTGDGNKYEKSRVLMFAYPTSPSFLINTKKIAGIITADYNQREIEITEQNFTVEKTDAYKDNWKEAVKEESAYVYQVKTTGNYNGSGVSGQRQEMKITWDPNYYFINPNDKHINELGTVYDKAAGTMIIETLPYASIKFVFYKTTDFKDWISSTSDKAVFEQSINAEIVH